MQILILIICIISKKLCNSSILILYCELICYNLKVLFVLYNNGKERINMNKFLKRYGHIVSAFALVITTISANNMCFYIFHQPKLPETAKKLRKF